MIARQGDILQTSFLFGGAVIALAAATLAVNAAADGDSARQLKLWGLIAWICSVATPFGRRATATFEPVNLVAACSPTPSPPRREVETMMPIVARRCIPLRFDASRGTNLHLGRYRQGTCTMRVVGISQFARL